MRVKIAVLALSFCFVSGSAMLLAYKVYTQSVSPVVIEYKPYPKQPIEIKNVQVFGKELSLNSPVKLERDWVRTFALDIENTSGKTVLYVQLGLDFPLNDFPLSDTRRENYRVPLNLGQLPTPEAAKSSVALMPGETKSLLVESTVVDLLDKKLSIQGTASALNKSSAAISLIRVYFDDNTMWAGGTLFKWDSVNQKWVNSGRFDRIDSSEQQTVSLRTLAGHGPSAMGVDQNLLDETCDVVRSHPIFSVVEGACYRNDSQHTFCGSCGQQVDILIPNGAGHDAANMVWTYMPCTNAQNKVDPACGELHWQSTEGLCPY